MMVMLALPDHGLRTKAFLKFSPAPSRHITCYKFILGGNNKCKTFAELARRAVVSALSQNNSELDEV